jgi:hypothetical protein
MSCLTVTYIYRMEENYAEKLSGMVEGAKLRNICSETPWFDTVQRQRRATHTSVFVLNLWQHFDAPKRRIFSDICSWCNFFLRTRLWHCISSNQDVSGHKILFSKPLFWFFSNIPSICRCYFVPLLIWLACFWIKIEEYEVIWYGVVWIVLGSA